MKIMVINFKNIKIPVLMYHDFVKEAPVEDPFDFQYIKTAEGFEQNVRYLLKKGFKTISLKDLYDVVNGKRKLPKKPFIITFDDGYESQYTLAYPIVKKYKIKATIFVTTDYVGKNIDNNKYFGWIEAKEMQSSGLVDICSHGKRHIAYDTVPIEEFKNDILESFNALNKNLGCSHLKIFAYPYGIHNQDMVNTLKESGVDIQANGLGINYINTIDLSLIKRMNIPNEMTGEQIVKNI